MLNLYKMSPFNVFYYFKKLHLKVLFLSILCSQFNVFASELISFNIPKQPVNTALISFAEQSDTTIIFSFNLTKNYQANAILGFYPTKFALKKLLHQSGLIAQLTTDGKIKIEKAKITQTTNLNHTTDIATEHAEHTISKIKVTSDSIEKISILGSRNNRRSISTLPVPVDILTLSSLNSTGHIELVKLIQTLVPSFNRSTSAISDGSDVLHPTTLRGLGPDQTLVLINGKRRHQASLIHINSSVGRGTAGVDMNSIPIESIAYVEILKDGASAQYGSDAIAGVINIVLKGKHDGGNISLSSGMYSKGDGETVQLSVSKGLIISENFFINTTLNMKEHGNTNRSGEYGTCQYKGCTELNDGSFLVGDRRELDAPRKTFNIGDAFYNQLSLTVNSEYLSSYGKFYSFLTYSNRENISSAFFRHNADSNSNIELQDGDATISEGYLPNIHSKITDFSFNLGKTFRLPNNAAMDVSYTFGRNNINYHVKDSINASQVNAWLNQTDKLANDIRTDIPREAFAYGLKLSLQTLNIDYTQHFDHTSIAFGVEHRVDHYSVIPGELYAYNDYDSLNGENLFDIDRLGGIQGFPGISPSLSVDESRTTQSVYLELDSDLTDNFNIIAAVRYDASLSYQHSTNYKFAGHWGITESFSLRGNISTGFRAPSMQQLYFNNISTQFIVNNENKLVPEVVKTYRNDSEVARGLGIKTLVPEDSTSISLGGVYHLSNSINLSLDYYNVNIEKRIILSNKIDRSYLLPSLHNIDNDITKGQFFLNGAESTTEGVDIITTWDSSILKNGALSFTLAANFTETSINRLYPLYSKQQGFISSKELYSAEDISIIEEWQPKYRIHLSALYVKEDWQLNLSLNQYGKYTISDGDRQTYTPKLVTDIKVDYTINNKLSIFFGSDNLFGITPDKNMIGNSRAGKIVDDRGNVIVESEGVFKYSRRSAPFGYNGAYFYAGLSYQL